MPNDLRAHQLQAKINRKKTANLEAVDSAATIIQTCKMMVSHYASFCWYSYKTCPTPLPRSTNTLPAISHSSIWN